MDGAFATKLLVVSVLCVIGGKLLVIPEFLDIMSDGSVACEVLVDSFCDLGISTSRNSLLRLRGQSSKQLRGKLGFH
jgi:hypothetical protein